MGERMAVVADTLGEVTPSRPFKELVVAVFKSLVAPRRDRKRAADDLSTTRKASVGSSVERGNAAGALPRNSFALWVLQGTRAQRASIEDE